MDQTLTGMQIAILLTDGFEQVELTGPREALQRAGATTIIISEKPGTVQGFNHDVKADAFDVDRTFDDADPREFDGVLLPGGVMNADQIRMLPKAREFVQALDAENKTVAVICHGAWLLISARLTEGRALTSWPSLQDDIRNAGGTWTDAQVVVDQNWVSSRNPSDIPAFNQKVIEVLENRVRLNAGSAAERGAGPGVSS